MHLDLLKIAGSQLIVLHHFSAYGPLAEAVYPLAPTLMDWMFEYARMAVQIFLVLGGYLAAASMAPQGHGLHSDPWSRIGRRFVRLVVPRTEVYVGEPLPVEMQLLVDPQPAWLQIAAVVVLVTVLLAVASVILEFRQFPPSDEI